MWAMWSDQCLEVVRRSSVDVLECQHHHLELDAGSNKKPVEVTGEEGHMGEYGFLSIYNSSGLAVENIN